MGVSIIKTFKTIIFLIVIGIGIVLIYNFYMSNTPSRQIIGTWRNENGYTYIFSSNGRFQDDVGISGTYQFEGEYIILSSVWYGNEIYRYELKGDSLKLYFENGTLHADLKRFK